MEAGRLGEMASREGQRRGFLRGEERAVVTAGTEDGHGPGGQGAGKRPDARVEGVAVGRRDPDRTAAESGSVRDHVAGGERRGRCEGTRVRLPGLRIAGPDGRPRPRRWQRGTSSPITIAIGSSPGCGFQ
jgi:hypothetical protein